MKLEDYKIFCYVDHGMDHHQVHMRETNPMNCMHKNYQIFMMLLMVHLIDCVD